MTKPVLPSRNWANCDPPRRENWEGDVRNISFALTTHQFLDGSKTVTRRLGWKNLKQGDMLMAVEKAQGLKKGEKVKRLGAIRVRSVVRESLFHVTDLEARREGFPQMDGEAFTRMFCQHMRCNLEDLVTRIEFERIGGQP